MVAVDLTGAPPTLDTTIGAAFISIVVVSLISGTTCAQTYMYYHNYPQDSLLNKCAVGLLWAMDTCHLVFVVGAIYFYNITEYGNLLALLTIPMSLKIGSFINIVIIMVVHALYARRVWILGGYHKGILGYIVASIVGAGASVGFLLVYVMFKSQTFKELEQRIWALYLAISVATAVDFLIAGAMCYYLRKSKTTTTKLNSKISRAIQYVIGSGLFTSAASLSALFANILSPNPYICLSITFLVTKLYTGSFLAMLNSRDSTEKRRPEGSSSNGRPNSTWSRSLKIVTNSSGSISGLRSPAPEEAAIQLSAKTSLVPPHFAYNNWHSD